MAKNGAKKSKTPMKGTTDLNALAKTLSEKYGIDFNTILELLMKWGPAIVQLVLSFFNKSKAKMGSVACSDDVKEHLDKIIEKQTAALAESICTKCCLCPDDEDDDEDDDSDE